LAVVASTKSPEGNLRARLAEIRKIEKSEGLPAAERALINILREGPQTHQGFIALARILMKQRQFDDALRAAQKARAVAPLEVDPVVAVGLANLRLRDHPAAAAAFAEAIRLDPDNAQAHLGAAAVKLADEDYDEALELCEKVVNLDPSLERAHELIARINMKKGDKGQAIAELRSLVQKNPENRRALRAYVQVMRREGRGEEVLSFLEAEVEAHPGDARRPELLARIGAKFGHAEYATEQYERLVDEGEERTGDKVRYAMLLIEAARYDQAREVIDSLGSQKVLRPVTSKLHGDIAYKQENYDEAIRFYQAACRNAQVDMIDPAAEAEAADAAERAKLWRAHTRKSILTAARDRRKTKG
jgi:cytochrome c-type biogenesis protein CcmH/NrfG